MKIKEYIDYCIMAGALGVTGAIFGLAVEAISIAGQVGLEATILSTPICKIDTLQLEKKHVNYSANLKIPLEYGTFEKKNGVKIKIFDSRSVLLGKYFLNTKLFKLKQDSTYVIRYADYGKQYGNVILDAKSLK
jgi:hypothetical protein